MAKANDNTKALLAYDEAMRTKYPLLCGVDDLERASIMVLDEFRGGKFGRISLEKPP